ALQHLGHQRGRGGGDGAAAPLEAHILDHIAVQLEIDGNAVAAKRVMALGRMGRMGKRMEIARMAPVIEDDILVKLARIHRRPHPNIFCAAISADASASMSLSSL